MLGLRTPMGRILQLTLMPVDQHWPQLDLTQSPKRPLVRIKLHHQCRSRGSSLPTLPHFGGHGVFVSTSHPRQPHLATSFKFSSCQTRPPVATGPNMIPSLFPPHPPKPFLHRKPKWDNRIKCYFTPQHIYNSMERVCETITKS